MGILDLDQKWGRRMQKTTPEGEYAPSCVWPGWRSLSLVSPARNPLAPSLTCILGLPLCLLSIRGKPRQLSGSSKWQEHSLCPKATWPCLRQCHQCHESFLPFFLPSFLSSFLSPFLCFRGISPQKKRNNRLMDFLLSTVCLEPSDPGSFYADTLPR